MRSPCASLSEPDNCPTIVDTGGSPTIIKLAPTSHYPAPRGRGLALHESIFLSNTDQNSCCDIAGLPALTLFVAKPAFLLDHNHVHLL